VNRDLVAGEVKRAGFVLVADYDFVKPDGDDYFLIFRLVEDDFHRSSEASEPGSIEQLKGSRKR
jgi:hypothetical protein